ncbi:MAG: zinc ribbon domain-containing protein [Planctomycetota bacterium]
MFTIKLLPSYFLELQKRLGLMPNSISPLERLSQVFAGAAPEEDSQASLPVAEDDLRAAMVALCQPTQRVHIRIGGNFAVPEQYLLARAATGPALAGVEVAADGQLVLQAFASGEELIEWLIDVINPQGLMHAAPCRIPRQMTHSQLVHALHLIDMYRRCYYQSMLDYTVAGEPEFGEVQFAGTMGEALTSVDYRWVLPSARIMAPTSLPLSMETQIPWLVANNLIQPATDAAGAGLWTFAEDGEQLGLEFMTGWLAAAGVEVGVLDGQFKRCDGSVLVLSTVRSMHTFAISGRGAEYQAAGDEGLRQSLQNTLAQGPSSRVVAAPAAGRDQPPAQRFCSQCGAKIQPGDKFCCSCGRPVVTLVS